ncbi:hypothetical protein BP5796_07282 [Coleophoma crateriformis]|uniref:Programmed cell death protein 2 C-terminal domain-containing protein n=1 Tax=Coleophoma crateriformis TaxID=565419 RepID=A0A3D8RIP0_9HELO|nr:hypothetical protein BP5796_07282 [Coleophoma crateriformis]
MVLLLQLNGDLPEIFPGHERRLYVFSCRRKSCRRIDGSVRALRGIRTAEVIPSVQKSDTISKAPVSEATKPSINIGQTLFGGSSSIGASSSNPFSTTPNSGLKNPFSSPGSSISLKPAPPPAAAKPADVEPPSTSTTVDLPQSFASALSLNMPKLGPPPPPEPWPQALPPAYPLYYLADADYEILDKIGDLPVPGQTMQIDEDIGSSSQKEDKVVYESTIDKTFQKFADRLAQNPEQVIRYEFKGQPLLYSKHDIVGKLFTGEKGHEKVQTSSGSGNKLPRCGNCGTSRVFEVQLTPHAIMELESEEMSIDGMEWGTIIVGVCEKDCQQQHLNGDVGYVEEFAGVQWEEMKSSR